MVIKRDAREFQEMPWEVLNIFQIEIDSKFRGIEILLENLISSEEYEKKKFKETLENDPTWKSLDRADQFSYEDQFYDTYGFALVEHKRIQKHAAVQIIYSEVESMFKKMCSNIEAIFDFRIKIKDLKGSGNLAIFWKYLEKVAGIPIDSKCFPYYQGLMKYRIIRNEITHNQGFVKLDKINSIPINDALGLKLSGNHQIVIEHEFLKHLSKIGHKFLEELIYDLGRNLDFSAKK